MNLFAVLAVIAALLSPAMVHADPGPPTPRVGEVHEITRVRSSSQRSDTGSSGSSRDVDTIVERVIGVRADGLELEYDLPKTAKANERARDWQFPARVFKPYSGATQLLNRAELEARIDGWLKTAGWPRTACGQWIFTWNAFRIECDPQTVIGTIETFDLRPADLREGAPYQVVEALAPGTLARKASGPDGVTFMVELKIDPDRARRARAEADVVVGKIIKKEVTLDAALHERAKEAISGTILITFDADTAGTVRRRTAVTNLQIKGPGARSETRVVTETVERRRLAEPVALP